MTTPTRNVTVKIFGPDNTPCPDGTPVYANLDQADVYQGFVVPKEVKALTTAGIAVLPCFPNHPTTGLGTVGSFYTFRANPKGFTQLLVEGIQVPDNDCTLDAIASLGTAPTLTAAQAAQAAAAASAGAAGTSATAAAASAAAAATSATNSATSATASAGSATASAGSAAASAASAGAAANSEALALASKTAAATSATNAATSATTATTAKTAAETARDAASTSATAAAASAAAALASANDASVNGAAQVNLAHNEAVTAGSAATSAAASAAAAATSAGSVGTLASQAATSAASAGVSAVTANAQAIGAAASAASASSTLSTALGVLGSVSSITAALAITLGYATTAQGAQSLAQAYAAQAASVVQQDLSGVQAGALHRSPNAVTAMALYDVSKDSDPGWIDRCGNLSYLSEALQGAWLTKGSANGIASELEARSIGSTLGAEMIVAADPTFASAAGWTLGTGVSIANGNLIFSAVANGVGALVSSTASTSGALYKVTIVVSSITSGALRYAGAAVTAPDITAAGTYAFYINATAVNPNYSFVAIGATTTAVVDSISMKPVTAFTTASGNYYQSATDGKFYRLWRNLLKATESWNDAAWNGNTTITKTTGIADPNGGTAAVRLTATGANSGIYQSFLAPLNATAISSMWIRRVSGTGAVTLSAPDGTTTTSIAGSLTGTWQRFQTAATGPFTGTSFFGCEIFLATSGDVVEVAFPQLELGAAITDYEAKTATNGTQTEVFRGNKAKHPKHVAWIAEASRVVGYDLTEPGRPMWMVFKSASGGFGTGLIGWASGASSVSSIATGAGRLWVGSTQSSIELDFAADRFKPAHTASYRLTGAKNLAERNNAVTFTADAGFGYVLPSATVNAVAMTTMPDAPVDPVTGLQVPTIAVATNVGTSIIQNNGTVATDTSAVSHAGVSINPYVVTVDRLASAFYYALAPGKLTNGWTLTLQNTAQAPDFVRAVGIPAGASNKISGRGTIGKLTAAQARFSLMRLNEAAQGSGLAAQITDTYNTGWMAGDIRRAYACDVLPGTLAAPELVTNGTFTTDTSGWVGANGTIASSSGQLQITTNGTFTANASQVVTTAVGQTYLFSGTMNRGTCLNTISATLGGTILATNATTTPTPFTAVFTATSTSTTISLQIGGNETGTTALFDNISLKACVADRSYKGKSLAVNGTLALTAVASASQLVALGGFSNSNYLQEAANTDLDPGTGGVAVSIFGTIPTGVAAAGWGVDRSAATGAYYRLGHSATGQIVGEVNDGTTTRTVTTTGVYNSGTFIKAEMALTTSGSLTLWVNGRQVQQTTGAPLLTLSNATAVFTVGNRRALDAAWAGSLALVKVGMTVVTPDHFAWMYEQEKEMFADGAQVTLPDSGALVDLAYDARESKWKVASAANESTFTGLVRAATAAVSAGSFIKVAHDGGVKLMARSTTNPGVDVTIPAKNLIEELQRRNDDSARAARPIVALDWTGGFTGNITTGSALVASVANLVIPTGCTIIGATVSGTGIPGGTTVLDFQGTTIQLSAAATATTAGLQINFLDFILPTGFEAVMVNTAGTGKQEGSTKDFTRTFNGMREGVKYAVAPGNSAWVQIEARRAA